MLGMDGYYVSKNDDTIKANFWLPVFEKGYNVMLFMVRYQIFIHDSTGESSQIYPKDVKSVHVEGYMKNKFISSYLYEKGKYCFVKCLGLGKLSCYEIPESFKKSKSELRSSISKEKSTDINFHVGVPTFTNYIVQLEEKKPLFCGQSLFKYRRELAHYLSDYPLFAKMRNVKRGDWRFESHADVISTFNLLYDKK